MKMKNFVKNVIIYNNNKNQKINLNKLYYLIVKQKD